ncbi:MAG TPA: sigma-70 family RNA polymerase sigma factor [Dermatophilaceae bacterium]|nr:sigma-70 family RNA polymerase sigma factor [Dermatophilaceae bacterium]
MIGARPSGDTLVARAAVAFTDYRDGDRQAFDALLRMVTPLLWHTARGQGIDQNGVEDVLQTVWMSLLRNADSVRDPRTVVKWLLTTTRREAWRVSRQQRAHLSTSLNDGDGGEVTAGLPADESEQPDAVALRSQRERVLWGHVQQLSPRCRELLRVIAFADRPDYAVVAESLGMPIGSIGPTRGRCLAKLRTVLTSDPAWEA